jgi:hypothetical protein
MIASKQLRLIVVGNQNYNIRHYEETTNSIYGCDVRRGCICTNIEQERVAAVAELSQSACSEACDKCRGFEDKQSQ